MTARVTIAVLMACHNRRDITLTCLRSLERQVTDADLHLVVFDDGSTDGTAQAVRDLWRDATILSGSGSAYWAGGMSAAFGWAMARGFDFYLWLNDDVVLDPDAIERLRATCRFLTGGGDRLGIVGGAVSMPGLGEATYGGVVRATGLNPLRFRFCPPRPDAPLGCDTLNGNVVLIPHATAAAVGLIDGQFVHTLADLDYGLRVGRAGGWVGLAPGFVGTCRANAVSSRWFNPTLPLAVRWALVNQPLGFPWRPWLHFARRHGGAVWPLFVPWPYWRLFVPSRVSGALARRRARLSGRDEAAHAS